MDGGDCTTSHANAVGKHKKEGIILQSSQTKKLQYLMYILYFTSHSMSITVAYDNQTPV